MKKTAQPHPGSKWLSSKIGFKTDEGFTHHSTVPASKDGKLLANEVAMTLVYTHGYEEAKKILNDSVETWKHSFGEDE